MDQMQSGAHSYTDWSRDSSLPSLVVKLLSFLLFASQRVHWSVGPFYLFFSKTVKSIILSFDYNIMRSAVVVLLSLSSIALADSACPARSTVTVTEYEQLYETATKVAAADVKSSCTRSTTTTTTTEKVYVSQVQCIPKHQPWTNWGSTLGYRNHWWHQ